MNKHILIIGAILLAVAGGYYAMRGGAPGQAARQEQAHGVEEEFERGPHKGRMMRKNGFALELTIFEDGVPPQFRVFTYEEDKPIDPAKVQLTIELKRLSGEVNRFNFTPRDKMLTGEGVVEEPHSFDVSVTAVYGGENYNWSFPSYEGRTVITPEAAEAAGVKTEEAGSAMISETAALTGRTTLNQNKTAQVKARFPGIMREVRKGSGETVNSGEVLALVESNESLQVYAVKSPVSGVIIARNTNAGEVAGDAPLFTITDISDVWAEFHVFPRDIDRVKTGQKVLITSFDGGHKGEAVISMLLPVAEASSQTVVARVTLPNAEGAWRAGMTVRGDVVIAEKQAAVAVKSSAIQRIEGDNFIFIQSGENYEAQPVQLGASGGEWTEVLEGLQAGQRYVSENSFLIKAQIGKSGASHDH